MKIIAILLSFLFLQALQSITNDVHHPTYTIVHTASCQNTTQPGGSGESCTTSAISVTAHHQIALFAWNCSGNFCNSTINGVAITISDSCSDTVTTPAGGRIQSGTTYVSQVAVIQDAVGGSCTFTTTSNATATDLPTLLVGELSGASTTGYDSAVTSAATATSTNPTITSGSVGQASEFIFAGALSANPTANQTSIVSIANTNLEYTVGPSSGTQVMNWTDATSSSWTAGVIGLKH